MLRIYLFLMATNQDYSIENKIHIKPIRPNEEPEYIGEQFSTLLQSSSSLGTHFQFTVEKQWDDTKNLVVPSYFVLNLESLAKDLSDIPFFERHQLSQSTTKHRVSAGANSISCRSKREKNSIALCLENADIVNKLEAIKLPEKFADSVESTRTAGSSDMIAKSDESSETSQSGSKNSIAAVVATEDDVSLDDWLESVLED